MGPLPIDFPETPRDQSQRTPPERPTKRQSWSTYLPILPVLAAGLLAGCISDGPNQTGAGFLSENGIVFETPLYHVKVKDFPVAKYWTTDAEPSHLNDTILLAGVQGKFTAEPRFAFDIADSSLLDSLSDSTPSLRLSLSTPIWKNVGAFIDNGTQALESLADSGKVRHYLDFAVLSWDSTNAGLSDDDWNKVVADRNHRFLINGDTLARLPVPTVRDTIRLKVDSAYSQPAQLQANALPNLKAYLADKKGRVHLIQMRLIPLPGSDSTDTLPAMLRLGGQWAYDDSHRPALLFGRPWRADSLDGHNRLTPMDAGSKVSYTLRYDGPSTDLVVPFQRGLHITFDRTRLLDSLDAALIRKGDKPQPRSSDTLSLQYYVPFASITLPIQKPTLEAGLPVQFRLYTGIDTLLGDVQNAGTREDRIPLGDSVTPWYTTEVGHPETIVNKVSLSYAKADTVKADSLLRRVILSFSKDTTRNDTVFLPVGGYRQINFSLTGYGQSNSLVLQLTADTDTLLAQSYLSLRSGVEHNDYRDPNTGDPITLVASLLPHYVQPESDSIDLRATGGIRTLINRTLLGTDARQDFEFRPYYRAFNPKAAPATGDTVAHEVVFPVLSVIQPRIDSGAISVDLDVYLYPLKAR
ncbi:MAG: hypothetical protein JF616_05540 [Fibrobacteres bacterium]|nr:hypothetical protein [Fibrobacterota bacterium]